MISGSLNRKICIWNIESNDKDSKLKPFSEYHLHNTSVENVNWNKINPYIFANCGQDRLIAMYFAANLDGI
jgi:WD40 repeat protein